MIFYDKWKYSQIGCTTVIALLLSCVNVQAETIVPSSNAAQTSVANQLEVKSLNSAESLKPQGHSDTVLAPSLEVKPQASGKALEAEVEEVMVPAKEAGEIVSQTPTLKGRAASTLKAVVESGSANHVEAVVPVLAVADKKGIAEEISAKVDGAIVPVKKAGEVKALDASSLVVNAMKTPTSTLKDGVISTIKTVVKPANIRDVEKVVTPLAVSEKVAGQVVVEEVLPIQKPSYSLHSYQPEASLTLSSLLPEHHKVLRLSGSFDSAELSIPVSTRVTVKEMTLHVVFSNSLSLSKARSQLRFRFNGHIIGQVKLDPDYPEGEIDLMIPTELIHDGDNSLKLESSLYTGVNTSTFGAFELWAEMNAESSTVSLVSTPRDIDLKLSTLKDLVRGSSWYGDYPLSVLMATKQPSDAYLNAASHAVQGIAMLTEGVAVKVHASMAEKAELAQGSGILSQLYTPINDVDAVLIGTYDELTEILGEGVIDSSRSTEQLLLRKHPLHLNSFILLVTGKTEADVLSASKHFTQMNLALANRDQVSFNRDNRSAQPVRIENSKVLKPMMRYKFSQLGIDGAELRKYKDHVDLPLRMPADLFATQDNHVEVSFHFSYTPGMGIGSRLNIFLNGSFQYSISTDDPDGLLVGQYIVKLPLRSFKKGMNTVRIESNIMAGEKALRNDLLRKNIKISIYGDSIVRIPEMSQYARLPDLLMLKDTGYPYVEHRPSRIALASLNDTNSSSALTIVAKIAQLQKRPVPEVTLTANYGLNEPGNVLLIGAINEVKPEFFEASPFKLKQDGFLFPVSEPYSDQGVPHNAVTTVVGFEHVIDAFSRQGNASEELQYLDMTDHAVLSQFEMPWSSGDSLSLLTTANATNLLAAVHQLVDDDLWHSLAGDTFVWDLQDEGGKGYALELSTEYHTGSLSFWGKVAYYAIIYPIYLILGMIGIVIILTWLTRKLIILQHDSRT